MSKAKWTLTLEPSPGGGTLDFFHAWVNNKKVIADYADKKTTVKGETPSIFKLTIKVSGVGSAKYKIHLDFPGSAQDVKAEHSLVGGYHEIRMNTIVKVEGTS